ncbi:ATP-binding protein [Pseudokordiimonas caeni]|uniref:ATP-binding protein n=1 Tax=Pseudokordiimonas caeni TaxID=2997908 RepID=UPI002812798E|nr:ATP-binding protein [Pseudokordiimonas caeni]
MTEAFEQIGVANASPTKAFFVNMLTRDIELQDAILDLLDNCLDGIVRGSIDETKDRPFEGYFANITMTKDHFVIEDNCGGIPFDVGEKSAFALGRPPRTPETHTSGRTATIGMYGIGMKRAIFKMGTEALVESHHDTPFYVEFTSEWMSDEAWSDLPMYKLHSDQFEKGKTRIEVVTLNQDTADAFSKSTWIEEFRNTVRRHYALIIEKGFSVSIFSNDRHSDPHNPLSRQEFKLLHSDNSSMPGRIEPFIYIGEVDGVRIEVYAGLYRKLLDEEEAQQEEMTRGTADDAGWTVACNDRVVIWKDKSRLTGWGETGIPNYHSQFIAITGIVLLYSTEPKKLPLTTTKRGVDASTNIYSTVKDLMKRATKQLTSFTNKWKGFPREVDSIYAASDYISLKAIRALPETVKLSTVRSSSGMKMYEPKYPLPEQEKTSRRVSFVALKTDVEELGKQYFGDPTAKPGLVGEQAFAVALRLARGDTQ